MNIDEKTFGVVVHQRDQMTTAYHNMQIEASLANMQVKDLQAQLAEALEARKCAVCGCDPCAC